MGEQKTEFLFPRDYEEQWRKQREQVLARDDRECRFCGMTEDEHREKMKNGRSLEVHHIIPRKRGGSDKMWNLVTVCRPCHRLLESMTRKVVEGEEYTQEIVPRWALSQEGVNRAVGRIESESLEYSIQAHELAEEHSDILGGDAKVDVFPSNTRLENTTEEEAVDSKEAEFWYKYGMAIGYGEAYQIVLEEQEHDSAE